MGGAPRRIWGIDPMAVVVQTPNQKSAAQQIAEGREMPTVPVLPPVGGIFDCDYPFGRVAFRTRATSRAVVEDAWLPQLERMKFTTSATS
jgi:hypothetical protein